MLAKAPVPIGPDDRTDEVERVLADVGGRLLVETVDRLARGPIAETPQDESLVTYAPRLTKDEGLVDWARSAQDIHNQVRGLHPWPHAFTYGPAGRVILHRSAIGEQPAAQDPPGTILPSASGEDLRVATGKGVLHVLELQAEGGRTLPARTFLAGHSLPPGTMLRRP
jgi:methionyl-tRNA formyltransferase